MIKHATKMLMLLSGCISVPYSCASITHDPPRPKQTIYVPETYNWEFDARPGDTVILIMETDDPGAALERCNNYGGELIYNPFTWITTCEKVDF